MVNVKFTRVDILHLFHIIIVFYNIDIYVIVI